MKKYIVINFLVVMQLNSFCQESSDYFITGYNTQNYLQYFDSLHRLKIKESTLKLDNSYYCYLKFEIDSQSNIKKFGIIEMPEMPLPETAKKYMKDLILSTNGKWRKVSAYDSEMPQYLIFSVSLKNKKETIEEALKTSDKYFDFLLNYMPLQAKLNGYTLKDEKWLHLSF